MLAGAKGGTANNPLWEVRVLLAELWLEGIADDWSIDDMLQLDRAVAMWKSQQMTRRV